MAFLLVKNQNPQGKMRKKLKDIQENHPLKKKIICSGGQEMFKTISHCLKL